MSSIKLHSSFFHPTLRKLQEDTSILPHNLMYPVFIISDDDCEQEIPSMPGVKRYGINSLIKHLTPIVKNGLESVLLFGVIDDTLKDESASNADSPSNPVIRALPKLRKQFPNLLIACDVCLCPYASHGHCGVLNETGIDNAASIKRLAEISLSYAKAGAHIVAPSDMMDNRIKAMKDLLIANGFEKSVSVLSYSCKYASGFYGPFRDAAKSAPSFGDRKSYQLPPGSRGLSIRAAQRDVSEGADMLMVKPGLPYLDIVKQTKDLFPHIPLFIYQVSGEYAMLHHAAANGALNLKVALFEILTSMRRAGADCIISYYTPTVLEWIKQGA